MPDRIYRRAVELMEAELGDEMVALEPRAGECFGFNRVATSVWRELGEPKSFHQLRKALLAEYEVEPGQCDEQLAAFLRDLERKGLVRAV